MKYIENPALSRLAQALTHEGPECAVNTRIEAYSCKNVKRDKKLFRTLETAYQDDVSHSPPAPSWVALDREAEMTPFGPFDKHGARKTLYLLIATLNIAFPDHEFSDVKPSHFAREGSGAAVLNALSTTLLTGGARPPRTYSAYPPTTPDFFPSSVPSSVSPYDQIAASPFAAPPIQAGTHPHLFRILDEAIGLSDCEVYSYTPDLDSDPHENDDGDDDVPPIGSDSEDDDQEGVFDFDDYDGAGETRRGRTSPITLRRRASDEDGDSPLTTPSGALLWSSHWFFLSRKLKRILYVSVWARSKGMARSWPGSEAADFLSGRSASPERFLGWEGGAGAGARALGLRSSA
ncbi:Maf1 regulator-domain-containing protein [Schizophyllum amplum]|uniref:Repressor of RNA polymerase III transcription MAF1 n=1 Tax=Schizophyllum amplum TaxID=97359 RepID=A0A550CJN7_9AGAR|nr:Maf1 regulator-domain-containing protein [Auriculariopsis ampla]